MAATLINERNRGNWTLDGEPKNRGGRKSNKPKEFTLEEKKLLRKILERVEESMEHDKDGLPYHHPDADFFDGGRFMLHLKRTEIGLLDNLIEKTVNWE